MKKRLPPNGGQITRPNALRSHVTGHFKSKIIPMKSFYILISLIFIFIMGRTQDCPYEIHFTTQSQIDSFQIRYPNCTEIDGHIHIGGSDDITNLNGLSQITSIGGWLRIEFNVALTNLSGLEGITTANWLHINNNGSLLDLTGLNNLTSLEGWVVLYANQNLTSLNGLNSLTSIGGNLYIGEDIDGGGNPALANIEALGNLTSINGGIRIINNVALNSLDGIENIDASSIYGLIIYNNSSLSTCEVQSVCSYLASPNGAIEIHDNNSGCLSQNEVETACGVGFDEKGTFGGPINIYPNPTSEQFTIESKVPIHQGVIGIFSVDGHEIKHYQITESKMNIDIRYLPSGVYFVRVTCENVVRMFKIVKY